MCQLADTLDVSTNCILYKENPNVYIRNISVLLSNKPDSFVIAMEGVINALVKYFVPDNTQE